ncbi:MAG: efflux RND transporter periplasmic adaptor subunit [Pseudomonadota bacterium]
MRFLNLSPALVFLLAACGSEPEVTAPRPVAIYTVAKNGLTAREFTGTVEAPIASELSFQVSGRITRRLVDPGDNVRAGQALFSIDPADIALAQSAANADVAAAKASATRAASDFARLEGLVEAGAISQAEYDAAEAAKTATASNLQAAEARARETRRQRGYTTLYARTSGTVTDVFAQPGQIVDPGTPIVELAKAGPRDAVIAVPEEALGDLPREAVARPLGSETSIAASLKEVSGAADPMTRTFRVRYRLSGGAGSLPLGSTVTIAMEMSDAKDAIEVPLGALHDPGSGPGVWIIDAEDHARWQSVELLELREEVALVNAPLKPGARIVALGAHLVEADEVVREAKIGAKPAEIARVGAKR